MKLNEDVILKIYNEFLNSDLKTKSELRHACSFIFRNYFDPRFVEINNDVLILYFKYLLSKPQQTSKTNNVSSLQQFLFKELQKTFLSYQNLRFRNISSCCVEDFFVGILEVFNRQPSLMHGLYSYFYPKPKLNKESYQNSNKDQKEPILMSKKVDSIKKAIPFQLLYNNNDCQKAIIKSILKLAMEQGLQHNRTLSFEDYTFQQRIALEGLFEAFYNILSVKLSRHLYIKSSFMHLRCFELYNCQCNYTISIPLSPYLNTIKIIDSHVRIIIDGSLCPRLRRLTIDEEASLKLIGRKMNDFNQLEALQLRNISFFETQQLPIFNHLKSLRLNNYPTMNVTIPSMNDLQELFVQDSQLCDQIYIKPQPNLKFLRLWDYHSCLSLVDEDIQYIYSSYNSHTILSTPYNHRLSTSSTTSTLSNQSTSTTTTSSSMLSETDTFIDYPTYFPNVEYLRIGYCGDIFFIKQLSQRISTTVKNPSSSSTSNSSINDSGSIVHLPEKRRLRRFNLLFPNLKTLVIERSSDLVDYLKWFVPTLSLLTTLIFKDCHWGGNGVIQDNLNVNQQSTTSTGITSSFHITESTSVNSNNKKESEEEEEEEQERIEELLLRSNNLQAVLQKMRFPNTLSEIIFINCSQELTEFIKKVLQSRHLPLKYNDIQCNKQQLKKWWAMF